MSATKIWPGKTMRGFTLMEVMIVVVIVGILAAIAYPAYTEQVRQARRADATSALLNVSQQLERCFTQFAAYDSANCAVAFPQNSPDGHYEITAPVLNATQFTLTAAPVAGGVQAGETRCVNFSLTQAGVQTATGTLGNDCWRR
jgi:type IV pilus assembly protein PilE